MSAFINYQVIFQTCSCPLYLLNKVVKYDCKEEKSFCINANSLEKPLENIHYSIRCEYDHCKKELSAREKS